MQIIVDSLLTHFERAGHGHAVLILPGWADTSKSWTAVQKKLSEKYDVIVLDLPGFGGSQRSDESWNLDNYAEFISHFLSKLGTPFIFTNSRFEIDSLSERRYSCRQGEPEENFKSCGKDWKNSECAASGFS
jgi:hypothetical protein